LETASGQQTNRSHALVTVVADADDLVERLIDESRRGAFPKRSSRLNVTRRSRVMIGEEYLAYELKPRAPPIEIQKTDEVEMQDFRSVFSHDRRQIPARVPVTIRRVRQNFE